MTHTCNVCGVTKDASEFYPGVKSRCKECHKEKVRLNRIEKAEYYRTYDAYRYRNDPKVKKRHRKYQSTEAGKLSMLTSRQKWLHENQDKRAAHVLLGNAVRDGRVVKLDNCEMCGASDCRIHGHHDDYAFPLSVRWLCQKCHVAVHRADDERLTELDEAAQNFDATAKPRGRHVTEK